MTPTLTLAKHRPSVAPAADLFVVSTHKVRDRCATAPNQWVPYGTEHAWRPGTRSTLCGEFINGWTVFWERQFSARPAAACPACVEMTLPEASRRRLDPIERSVGRSAEHGPGVTKAS
jgi:hypothetical protein